MNPNPHGANSVQSDPREQVCWDFYIKGLSENRENAYKAAKDAGYSEGSAVNITTREWFIERKGKLRRNDMLGKAERNLDKVLDLEVQDLKGEINPQLLRIKMDVSTTIAKTLGKNHYSERTEHTGADGKDLFAPSDEEREKANKALEAIG